MNRSCVRCRVVAVPDGLHWCPQRLDEIQQVDLERGAHCLDEQDGSEGAADEAKNTLD